MARAVEGIDEVLEAMPDQPRAEGLATWQAPGLDQHAGVIHLACSGINAGIGATRRAGRIGQAGNRGLARGPREGAGIRLPTGPG